MPTKLHTNHIALADILANGVAVLLILITLSLSIKHQDLEKELQQISEIGSVMSREIASSLVTNALPSSAPAVLHSYNHPRRAGVAKIVMHKHQLFIESAGDNQMLNLRLSKEELLQKNNRFDDFLEQLSPQQKVNIRMDIIHTKNYYLVMSIIKTHKARIRDWHFIGDINAVGSGDYLLAENDDMVSAQSDSETLSELPPTPESENGILTQSVDFFLAGEGDATLFNSLESSEMLMDFGGGFGVTAQSLRNNLVRYMAQSAGINAENAHFIETLKIDFSDGSNLSGQQMSQHPIQGQLAFDKQLPVAKRLLVILLSYLAHQQSRYQAGEFVGVTADDFSKAKFKPLYQDYKTEIDRLYDNINAANLEFINLQYQTAKLADTGLALSVNQHLENADVFMQKNVQFTELSNNKLSVKLYPQPTISQGIRVEINANDVILFPYKHNQNQPKNWQPIAILNAQLSDVQIGFVYAKSKSKQLKIIAQENDIRLNQRSIKRYYAPSKEAHYWRWGLLTAILIIFILLLFNRHSRLKNVE